MSSTQVFQIVGIFWNLWPEINCRVALTKVFLALPEREVYCRISPTRVLREVYRVSSHIRVRSGEFLLHEV